ncbi:MAG: hypothetical protein J1F11_09370 [Oscillospiraceae bacterium]|nr:hypothetical protein [Oscillospiraceae bacterium]
MNPAFALEKKTIGFYSPVDKKLQYAELARSNVDIEEIYQKYGVKQ